MEIYFVTFKNVFDAAQFTNNFKEFFSTGYKPKIIVHNFVFIEFQVPHNHIFYSYSLYKKFNSVKITIKFKIKNKSRYKRIC